MNEAEKAGVAYRAQRRDEWRETHVNWPELSPLPAVATLVIDRESRIYTQGFSAGIAAARRVLDNVLDKRLV